MRLAILDRAGQWVDDRLRVPEEELGRWGRITQHTARLVFLVVRRFRRDLGLERAASLAFSTLIAAVPAALIALISLPLFLGDDLVAPPTEEGTSESRSWVDWGIERLSSAINEDQRAEVRRALDSLVWEFELELRARELIAGAREQSALALTLSGLVLLLSGMSLIRTAERAYTAIWRVDRRRIVFEKLALLWLTLTAAPVILGLAITVKGVVSSAFDLDPDGAGSLLTWTHALVVEGLFPISVSFFAFLLLLFYLPHTRVRPSAAAFGAILTAIGWVLGTRGFEFYLQHTLLSGILGILGVVPFFLIWIYLSWAWVLVGVETAYCVQHHPELVRERWEAAPVVPPPPGSSPPSPTPPSP